MFFRVERIALINSINAVISLLVEFGSVGIILWSGIKPIAAIYVEPIVFILSIIENRSSHRSYEGTLVTLRTSNKLGK